MFDLTGRVAVVTGASSGLGRQMSYALASQGADLVLLARRLDRLNEIKEEIEKTGRKVLALECDVTDTDAINRCAQKAKEYFGKVDILINCAGASKDKGWWT